VVKEKAKQTDHQLNIRRLGKRKTIQSITGKDEYTGKWERRGERGRSCKGKIEWEVGGKKTWDGGSKRNKKRKQQAGRDKVLLGFKLGGEGKMKLAQESKKKNRERKTLYTQREEKTEGFRERSLLGGKKTFD